MEETKKLENLYDRVIGLLGTTRKGAPIQQFVEDFSETPLVDGHTAVSNFRFNSLGVNLFYLNDHHCFYVAEFHLKKMGVHNHGMKLPFELVVRDSRADVVRKLNLVPNKFPSAKLNDEYEENNLVYTFAYDQGGFLSFVSVLYRGEFPL